MSMKKNRADQNGEAGRLATAEGYTTKASPAPAGRGQDQQYNYRYHITSGNTTV
jgi:hypothetical protein